MSIMSQDSGDGNDNLILLDPYRVKKLLRESKKLENTSLAECVELLRSDPSVAKKIGFDEFLGVPVVRGIVPFRCVQGRQWSDDDEARLCLWLQQAHGLKATIELAGQAARLVAYENKFDSLREDLEAMAREWDRKPRLATFGVDYFGVSDRVHERRACEVFMLAAAARGLKPGCKQDLVLILEGPQGHHRKSTAIRALFGEDRFTDSLSDFDSKDVCVELQGIHCVEIAELDNMDRASVGRNKVFFAKCSDRYVPKYVRNVVEVKRRCVFVGTSNGNSYLRDETGGRRFLCVETDHPADLDAIERDRRQLFGEAASSVMAGERWWLEGKEARIAIEEASKRYQSDVWEASIEAYVNGKESVTVAEILAFFHDNDRLAITKWTRNDQMRVAQILTRIGWVRRRNHADGQRSWRYFPTKRKKK